MTQKTRQLVVLAAAGVLVLTAIARAWFTARGWSMGLWGVEICDHGCHGVRWDDVPGAQDDLYLAGYVAFAASLVGAALSVAAAFGRDVVRATQWSLGVALVAMIYFVLRAVAFDGLPRADVSWAAFLGPAAAITAQRFVKR